MVLITPNSFTQTPQRKHQAWNLTYNPSLLVDQPRMELQTTPVSSTSPNIRPRHTQTFYPSTDLSRTTVDVIPNCSDIYNLESEVNIFCKPNVLRVVKIWLDRSSSQAAHNLWSAQVCRVPAYSHGQSNVASWYRGEIHRINICNSANSLESSVHPPPLQTLQHLCQFVTRQPAPDCKHCRGQDYIWGRPAGSRKYHSSIHTIVLLLCPLSCTGSNALLFNVRWIRNSFFHWYWAILSKDTLYKLL